MNAYQQQSDLHSPHEYEYVRTGSGSTVPVADPRP
jgi:hypothetical protein